MADLVERLRVLRREIELRWTGEFADNAVNTLDAVDARITTLEAEVARLRDGLERVAMHDPSTPGLHFESIEQLLHSAVGTALAALEPTNEPA